MSVKMTADRPAWILTTGILQNPGSLFIQPWKL